MGLIVFLFGLLVVVLMAVFDSRAYAAFSKKGYSWYSSIGAFSVIIPFIGLITLFLQAR
jgi:hypothetical protein